MRKLQGTAIGFYGWKMEDCSSTDDIVLLKRGGDMEKKSLISHICWVIVFLSMCYGFGYLCNFLKDGFLVRRELKYITMAMIAEPAASLILGGMLGILLYMGVTNAVSKRQILAETLVVEIPIFISLINEAGRAVLMRLGFQAGWVLDKPFYSVRLAAVVFIFFLYFVRKKVSCDKAS